MVQIDRRLFLKAIGATAVNARAETSRRRKDDAFFRSDWAQSPAMPWIGPEYWSNPLQDWRVANGRIELMHAGGDRNVHLLTREIADRPGDLYLSVKLGVLENAEKPRNGFVGFRIGINHHFGDYRASAIYGTGMNAGILADGRLFIGEGTDTDQSVPLDSEVKLTLTAVPSDDGYRLSLRAKAASRVKTAELTREVPREWIPGGIALVCDSLPVQKTPHAPEQRTMFQFYPPNQQSGGSLRCWFSDWIVKGSKVDAHEDRSFGPILFALYTVSRRTLKLSAQFPPMGQTSTRPTLEVRRSGTTSWKQVADAAIHPDACNAVFHVPDWETSQDWEYRVCFRSERNGKEKLHTYEGRIPREPNTDRDFRIGLLTCVWDFGFPHADFTGNLIKHKPDILLWTGDQVYEQAAGFGALRSVPMEEERSIQDFLRKWYVFGWAMRDLTRTIPSVCMTDDHDMYHGNIWGCGGRPTDRSLGYVGIAGQDSGGYKMSARWVNAVQHMQTSHLPDPFNPSPVLQGISVYYTDLLWGGVSFAILEDRKWKSAPKEQLPDARIENGFAKSPIWNPAREGDTKTSTLLGQRQLSFLESWAADWSGGTWMKFAVSQTIFAGLHTEPQGINSDSGDPQRPIPEVGVYLDDDHLVADYDSGAWPQHERDASVDIWRKAFAPHLCGDQHLALAAHYGVENFRDAVYSICTPAVSNIFPRRWFPPEAGKNARAGTRNTGDYLDAFGNKVTVLAVANPAKYPGPGLDGLRYRATGYTIVECNKSTRRVQCTTWPRWIDPTSAGAKPYHGWPISFHQLENGLHGAEWQLPAIETPEFLDPVIQVSSEGDGQIVYTVRIEGSHFIPLVREPGTYTVTAFDPDGFYKKVWPGVAAIPRTTGEVL